MKIMILGMGEIGVALKHILRDKSELEVVGWDKNASKFPDQPNLETSVADADVIFICVPSWNIRGALLSITAHVKPSAGIISLAKGLEKESCKTTDQLLKEIFPGHATGVLGGPMLAADILIGKSAAAVLGSKSAPLRSLAKKIFRKTSLRLVTSSDERGVALCGVLKNAYTLSLGIAEGAGMGENARGAHFAHALTEMRLIVKALGGKSSTVLGLAGAGDFFATAQSPHSRNRLVGITLGTGGDGHLESEGFISLLCLDKLTSSFSLKLTLLKALIKIANEQASSSLLEQVIFD
jgi:glycerol-3-phosphate dehydrogenase